MRRLVTRTASRLFLLALRYGLIWKYITITVIPACSGSSHGLSKLYFFFAMEIFILVLQDSRNSNNIQFFQLPLSLRSVSLTSNGRPHTVKFVIDLFWTTKVTCLYVCFSRSPFPFLPAVYFYLVNKHASFCWESLSHYWIGWCAEVLYILQCKYLILTQMLSFHGIMHMHESASFWQ